MLGDLVLSSDEEEKRREARAEENKEANKYHRIFQKMVRLDLGLCGFTAREAHRQSRLRRGLR